MFKKKDIVFLKEDLLYRLYTIDNIEGDSVYIHCNLTFDFYKNLTSNLVLHERPFSFIENFKIYFENNI